MEENKTAFEEKIRAHLKERHAEIDHLKAQMNEKKADAKIAYEQRLEELERQRSALEAKLDELSRASGSALEDLKKGISEAWDRFSSSVDEARQELK